MLLRIVGDGTFGNTRIETESGELVEGVTDLKIKFLKGGELPDITLKIRRVHFDMVVKQFDIKPESVLKTFRRKAAMKFSYWRYLLKMKIKKIVPIKPGKEPWKPRER